MTDQSDSMEPGKLRGQQPGLNGRDTRLPLAIDVVVEDGGWQSIDLLNEMVDETARAVSPILDCVEHAWRVTLALSDDARVAKLNATFRGKATPTNVLSFPTPAGAQPEFPRGPDMGERAVPARYLGEQIYRLPIAACD